YEIEELTVHERKEVADIFHDYGLRGEQLKSIVTAITADKKRWVDFMMRFELGLERPNPKRAWQSALTIAFSYLVGGLIPLAPYIANAEVARALPESIGFTGLALLVFGAVKGRVTGGDMLKSS